MKRLLAVLSLVPSVLFPPPAVASQVRPACPDVMQSDYFWPGPPDAAFDAHVRQWYAPHLRVMGEPSLSCGATSEAEVYRFLWLRTFHRPIAVRVARDAQGARLVAVELSGAGGYAPGAIVSKVEKSLGAADWQTLMTALAGIDFWRMPTLPLQDPSGLDGAQWIVEGRRGSDYHVVDRWTPREGAYRDAGLAFLKLAGIDVPAAELY